MFAKILLLLALSQFFFPASQRPKATAEDVSEHLLTNSGGDAK
jgi:hypothetical protein